MKKLFLSIILLTTFSVGLQASKMVDLKDPILKIVDGVPGAMDAVSLKKCFDTWSVINKIQYQNFYDLDGKQVTLKDVVILEEGYKKNHISPDNPKYKSLQKVLKTIKSDFIQATQPLLKDTENNATQKENNLKLVALYTKIANLVNSLLSSWGKADEAILLEKADSKTFFIFLNHLKGFLKSLMFSCNKARTMFKKECLKEEDHAAFDKFFFTT